MTKKAAASLRRHAGLDPPSDGRCNVAMGGWVYIVTNRKHGTLYVGVTSDLARRAYEHREGLVEGFTKRYGLKRLVWMEPHVDISDAIGREKSIKRWARAWKISLIEKENPRWSDLFETLNM